MEALRLCPRTPPVPTCRPSDGWMGISAMKRTAAFGIVSFAFAVGLILGCTTHAPADASPAAPTPVMASTLEVAVPGPPPSAVAEQIPRSPGSDYVWVAGAWVWKDHWEWMKGHWERPPHPGAVWIQNKINHRNGNYIFIRGGWR